MQNRKERMAEQKQQKCKRAVYNGSGRNAVKNLLRAGFLIIQRKGVSSLNPRCQHNTGDDICKGGRDCT